MTLELLAQMVDNDAMETSNSSCILTVCLQNNKLDIDVVSVMPLGYFLMNAHISYA